MKEVPKGYVVVPTKAFAELCKKAMLKKEALICKVSGSNFKDDPHNNFMQDMALVDKGLVMMGFVFFMQEYTPEELTIAMKEHDHKYYSELYPELGL